jgi:hypothetical protein
MTSIKTPSLFPRASFVGFDHLFSELDFVTRSAKDTYPPHNVVKIRREFTMGLLVLDSTS